MGSAKEGMKTVGSAVTAPAKMFGECCNGSMKFGKWTKTKGPGVKWAQKKGPGMKWAMKKGR